MRVYFFIRTNATSWVSRLKLWSSCDWSRACLLFEASCFTFCLLLMTSSLRFEILKGKTKQVNKYSTNRHHVTARLFRIKSQLKAMLDSGCSKTFFEFRNLYAEKTGFNFSICCIDYIQQLPLFWFAVSSINGTKTNIQRLSCILIGCILYGMQHL